jgi:putative oxidoreductase
MGKKRLSGGPMKVLQLLRKLVSNPYLALALRLYLGGVFVYASMYKINYAGEFAETIASYELAPFWAVNFLALLMPWTELICGLLLIIGVRAKSAAAMIASLLVLFSAAVLIALLRDLPIGCGCFHALDEQMGWSTLARDLIWLLMAIQIYSVESAWQLEKKFLMTIKDL